MLEQHSSWCMYLSALHPLGGFLVSVAAVKCCLFKIRKIDRLHYAFSVKIFMSLKMLFG